MTAASLRLVSGDISAPGEALLTAAQVGAILGVRVKRVYELGIPAVRLSAKTLRWRPDAVRRWIIDREGA